MLETIQDFDCPTWASRQIHSRSTPEQKIFTLSSLSQSYRLGALIYGRRVLDACTQQNSEQEELLRELMNVLRAVKEDRTLLKCMLWPTFIAGLECQSHADREFLTHCLELFWLDTNCLNAVNAARILQTYWQSQDNPSPSSSHWVLNFGQLDRDWLLV